MTTQQECPLRIEWLDRAESLRPRVITGYSLDSSFLTSTDEWAIELFDTDPARLRNLQLEPIILHIHDKPQLVQRVEHIKRGDNGGAVSIDGRDHLADILECNIDPTVRVTEDMTLAQAVLVAAGPCGIDTVFGEADVQLRSIKSGAPPKAGKDQGFGKLEPGNLKPEAGMGIFEWLNRLAARQGCTIQPGPTRNSVVLAAPSYDQEPIATFARYRDPAPARRGNVVSATADENYSKFPTCGIASGKVTSTGEPAKSAVSTFDVMKFSPALAAKMSGRVLGERSLPASPKPLGNALYRLLYVKDDDARKPEQVERAISRAMSERLRETLSYQVTVKGHVDHDTGYVFAVDTMATVRDEIADVDEKLWIESRRFTYQRGQGAVTAMQLLRPGSLVL